MPSTARVKSEKHPEKYLSVIIDGMDQQKTDIPHIITNPKAMDLMQNYSKLLTSMGLGAQCSKHASVLLI